MKKIRAFTPLDFLLFLDHCAVVLVSFIFSFIFYVFWLCAGGNPRNKRVKKSKTNIAFTKFHRQLKRSPYKGSIEMLLQHMLKTKKEDWHYQKKEYGLKNEQVMTHQLFKNFYLQVKEEPIRTNMSKYSIQIVRGKKGQTLFAECYVSEINDLHFVCDSILTDKRSSKAFAEHMWKIFDSYTPSQKEQEAPIVEYETIATIIQAQEALVRLQKEKNWLSAVSFHRISETLPYDLAQLHDVYQTIEYDEQASAHVEQALISVKEKIAAYEQEILTNKRLKLEQIENVIKKR